MVFSYFKKMTGKSPERTLFPEWRYNVELAAGSQRELIGCCVCKWHLPESFQLAKKIMWDTESRWEATLPLYGLK